MFAHCNDQRRSLTVYDIAPAPQQGQLIATRMFCFCSSSRSARSSICRACCWNSSCSERLEEMSWSSTAISPCGETTGVVRIVPDVLRLGTCRRLVCAAARRSLDFGHDVYAIVLVSVSIDPDLHLPRSSQDLSVTIVKVYFYKIHFSEDK